jgi:prepilin-type N-terminal cleavage/methylation domain-containing protein
VGKPMRAEVWLVSDTSGMPRLSRTICRPAHSPLTTRGREKCQGFTLVEILIVVVILGILAALVIPQFNEAIQQTKRASFVTSLKNYANAAEQFSVRTGQRVTPLEPGAMPTDGFQNFMDANSWVRPTSIGGAWHIQEGLIGVVFNGTGDTRDAAYMELIDLMLDDGDLTTGTFQQVGANAYYYQLAW